MYLVTGRRATAVALLALLQGCHQEQPDQAAALYCGADATAIQSIQGLGSASQLLGSERIVEAVLTHRLPHTDGGAVYLQDPEADPLNDASSGLFIDLSGLAPASAQQPGRLLRVAGTVIETNGQTGLKARDVADCGERDLPAAHTITSLPLEQGSLENLEGMRIKLQLLLTVTDLYRLGSAGHFSVASGGRLYFPTEVTKPGAAAQAIAASNRARSLIVIAAPGSIKPGSLPRVGDQLRSGSGVLGQSSSNYRLHLEQAPQFRQLNARSPAPERTGNLRISSFNLLNYFNGNGQGGDFPTPRGATSEAELERQQAKILAAMRAIDADVFALAELENDGYKEHSAVSQLTAALNASGKRRYAFVQAPDGHLGESLIAVGLLYDLAILRPKGPAKTIVEPPFDQNHRPPLVQSFTHLASDRSVTVVALHLKSKRCNNPQGLNADLGDGQGCWNAARTEATVFLADWLTLGSSADIDTDSILILGDYNAYSREDPLTALTKSGFVSVMAASPSHHSFVYQGRSASLDHGFASPPLAALARASIWHINADEAPWLDYNLEFKTAEIDALLYRPDAYRSSDHDPLIIDLRF